MPVDFIPKGEIVPGLAGVYYDAEERRIRYEMREKSPRSKFIEALTDSVLRESEENGSDFEENLYIVIEEIMNSDLWKKDFSKYYTNNSDINLVETLAYSCRRELERRIDNGFEYR